MRDSSLLLWALGAGVAIYLVTRPSSSANKKAVIVGYRGAQIPINVDANMSDADIAAMQATWNASAKNDDTAALQALIAQMTSGGHPVAAQSLASVYNDAISHQGAS